jgi:hypothetical protein
VLGLSVVRVPGGCLGVECATGRTLSRHPNRGRPGELFIISAYFGVSNNTSKRDSVLVMNLNHRVTLSYAKTTPNAKVGSWRTRGLQELFLREFFKLVRRSCRYHNQKAARGMLGRGRRCAASSLQVRARRAFIATLRHTTP